MAWELSVHAFSVDQSRQYATTAAFAIHELPSKSGRRFSSHLRRGDENLPRAVMARAVTRRPIALPCVDKAFALSDTEALLK